MITAVINEHEDIDFYSGHTIISDQKRSWLGELPADWSMVLTLNGRGAISASGSTIPCERGALILIAPKLRRSFHTDDYWDILWFRFLLRPHILRALSWQETVQGINSVQLSGREFIRAMLALKEAHRLGLARNKGWYELSYNLLENVLLRGNNHANAASDHDLKKINQAQKILSDLDKPVNMDEIAKNCGFSRSSFYRQFKYYVGTSPREYRELCALRQGQILLEQTCLSIKEIADQISMTSIYYFSRRFKKFTGKSPTEYRLQSLEKKI